jgi:hypothetical protein
MLSISPSAGSTGAPFFLSFFLKYHKSAGLFEIFRWRSPNKVCLNGTVSSEKRNIWKTFYCFYPLCSANYCTPNVYGRIFCGGAQFSYNAVDILKAASLLYYYVSSWEDIMKIDSWTALLTLIQIETVIIIKDIDSRCRLLPHNEDVVRERKELHVSSNFWC